ncbi:MAG: outer membrane protein [Verrucomicrobiaceae bacterium]|nr:outer membrane protein [Verrucomicrobiaceae bacterium]
MIMNRFHALCAALGCVGCASHPITTTKTIDLPRYMGSCYVIACLDNAVERKFIDPVESYELRPDKRTINVDFHWREGSFEAPLKQHAFTGTVRDVGTNAHWKMKLFPLFAASYIIMDTGPRYEWATVAHPSRKFGWILSRNPSMKDDEYHLLLEQFAAAGYDTGKFIRLPHHGAVGAH